MLSRWGKASSMKAIPMAVRERVIHLYDLGRSTNELAAGLGIAWRVRQHFQQRGTLEPQPQRCGRRKTLLAPPLPRWSN
jgi:hypothetical protein